MKGLRLFATVPVLVAVLALSACSQPAAPAPAPTAAPAAPSKPAEAAKPAAPAAQPTAAPAQPTAAPAKALNYPEKGKAVTLIVPYAPGGSNDIASRMLAPALEKVLGGSVQVVNRVGAASQVGITEVLTGKADGYALGDLITTTVILTYLDTRKNAVFSRKDIQPVSMFAVTGNVLAVLADGPYKSLKDLVDAAKARPNEITVGDSGIGAGSNLATLRTQMATDTKFRPVHFGGAGEVKTALLGKHIDVASVGDTTFLSEMKAGTVRIIAQLGPERESILPDVPTTKEQGFNFSAESTQGIIVRAGTPKEIVKALSDGIGVAMRSPEVVSKASTGLVIKYMDTAAYEAAWAQEEEAAKAILPLLLSQSK